jgi:hypothetical protein
MTDDNLPARSLEQIERELPIKFEAMERAWRDAVGYAIEVGEMLIEARSAVPEGAWMSWLEQHFPGSGRSARDYMRLARNADQVRDKLSIREAIALLAPPTGSMLPTPPELEPTGSMLPLEEERLRDEIAKFAGDLHRLSATWLPVMKGWEGTDIAWWGTSREAHGWATDLGEPIVAALLSDWLRGLAWAREYTAELDAEDADELKGFGSWVDLLAIMAFPRGEGDELDLIGQGDPASAAAGRLWAWEDKLFGRGLQLVAEHVDDLNAAERRFFSLDTTGAPRA